MKRTRENSARCSSGYWSLKFSTRTSSSSLAVEWSRIHLTAALAAPSWPRPARLITPRTSAPGCGCAPTAQVSPDCRASWAKSTASVVHDEVEELVGELWRPEHDRAGLLARALPALDALGRPAILKEPYDELENVEWR
ncbi:hypothetical protein G3I43_36335 [Streptomyces anulatus]|uniref:Uncharacterized protein n=1 Tax=Streptomyces anulatus TaxID=1892 RepID=A0A6G3T392_STRAQ|nr:hypothetical protein [Streptomyces anulatus]NEB89583.1 hypothetical protein [Streptomyces anulatus]